MLFAEVKEKLLLAINENMYNLKIGRYFMAKFNKKNFFLIIKELEEQEENNENFWLGVGILERMYDNYIDIDDYFHCPREDRNIEQLWQKINK